MDFEWDEAKRIENIEKHGFDFVSALRLFSGDHTRKRAHDGWGGEERWMATGIIHGLYATAIYTLRGEIIRMISLRRARDEERRHHQEVFG
ncbi:BrnT family toxin [Craurococcus roseus]|uniref:BrnT family toxin n=1 Tax=Craurococcus roseus TaxID=77585 RepID=A0ABN1EMF2_9PROT